MEYHVSKNFDFLMHHGIKGQSWGVQNGPPYPLDPKTDYSKAEQKANARKIRKAYIKGKGDKPIRLLPQNMDAWDLISPYRSKRVYESDRDAIDAVSKIDFLAENSKKFNKDKSYDKQVREFIDNALGEYGNKKITVFQTNLLRTGIKTYGKTIGEIAEEAIHEILKKGEHK